MALQSTPAYHDLLSLPTKEELGACWELCRLHNNIGFWVVYTPTVWSILMAYHAQPEISASSALMRVALYIPLCFGVKSLIMTIDDILDSDLDGLVERTKNRPLPRGSISLIRAWAFFVIQAFIGVVIALYVLSNSALRVSMLVWPLYIVYPTCKRWTNLAPIPLGLMFNIGMLMGWCDVHVEGWIPWERLLPAYIGTCMWTFTYETIYQHQDKLDDVKIGLHSPALLLGNKTIPVCSATSLGFLALFCYSGMMNNHGVPFYLSVAIAGTVLLVRLLQTNIDSVDSCRAFFLGTRAVGWVISAGFLIDVLLHRLSHDIPL